MLKTKILASAIGNLTDARYFAAMGVDWMSFNLNPGTEGYLSPTEALAIKEWVEGPQMLGMFDLHSAEEIDLLLKDLGFEALQLGMFSSLETILQIEADVPKIKEIVIEKDTKLETLESQLQDFAPHVSHFILNFEKAAWKKTDWQGHPHFNTDSLQELCSNYPMILAVDFSPEEMLECLDLFPIQGFLVKGGAEEKVGFKSYDELDEIFDALEDLE